MHILSACVSTCPPPPPFIYTYINVYVTDLFGYVLNIQKSVIHKVWYKNLACNLRHLLLTHNGLLFYCRKPLCDEYMPNYWLICVVWWVVNNKIIGYQPSYCAWHLVQASSKDYHSLSFALWDPGSISRCRIFQNQGTPSYLGATSSCLGWPRLAMPCHALSCLVLSCLGLNVTLFRQI